MRVTRYISIVLSSLLLAMTSIACMAKEAIVIEDALGTQSFTNHPQRVVALNWDILEQVLALDVVPIAAPNLPAYRQWVVNPVAPDEIQDIGTRAEPNLEMIARLKPDVILAASTQQDLLPLLKQIAPVIYLPNFSEKENAAQTAIHHYRLIAKLLGKTELAEKRLQQMDKSFEALRKKIENQYPQHQQKPLEVVVMRFASLNSVFMTTENSTAQYVLEKLGLTNPIHIGPRAWGIKQERINRLQYVEDGYVLYIHPFPAEAQLKQSRLWQAMPFVQNNHVNSVRPVWTYGGAMSLLYMAEAITDSLLELGAEQ